MKTDMGTGETVPSFHWLSFFTLMTSMSTLVCCALPALLVSLGMGAALAGLVSNVPQLVWLSEHKAWVFGASGLMLAMSGFLIWRNRNAPCPVDLKLRAACVRGRAISFWIWIFSAGIFGTGAFFAFVLPRLMS